MKKVVLVLLFMIVFLGSFSMPLITKEDEYSLEDEFTKDGAFKMIADFVRSNSAYSVNCRVFNDTNDEDLAYARALDLIPFEGDYFYPGEYLSQQDFLVALKRAADRINPNIFYDNAKIKKFLNKKSIADHAKFSLNYLTIIDIIQEGDDLRPFDPISREMAQMYIKRLEKTLKTVRKPKEGELPKTNDLKVLLYHLVETPKSEKEMYINLYVTPKNFEEQIKYLSEEGYTFLFPEEIAYASTLIKSVVITFDDGYEDNYKNALPILEKYNAKATVFMVSDFIDKPGYCTAQQLREMNASGVFRVYSHTVSHTDLTEVSKSKIKEELEHSKEILENITNRRVWAVAYPHGHFNKDTVSAASEYYKIAFSTASEIKGSSFAIKRIYVNYDYNLNTFKYLVKSGERK